MDDKTLSIPMMTEQDLRISEVIAEQRLRLRNFIRKRVPNEADVEDLLQEVFYELVKANRLLMPIEYVTGWLFSVARNRITDLFARKGRRTLPTPVSRTKRANCCSRRLLPSPDAGPEALYLRNVLLDELDSALASCPASNGRYLSRTNWRGAASTSCRLKVGVTVNTCSRVSAMQCFICAGDCRTFTMSL